MAGDTSTELLFLDTFKHQSAELTNVDVVRFPCGVLITEVRVIPPGIKAHSNLPDSRAFGETSPHAFQLELFFNNVTKPNNPVFHRLGSLEYDENKSIVFRPSGKVNTDGLVLRGWYTSLTIAVYGTAERSHGHDQASPPPPPPPPPQQPSGPKRIIKQEWEKDDQYNGSPPRPAPRGPRTPPGPPPPDDDDEEQVPVTVGVVKEEPCEGRDDYLEAVSPERSLPADETYSDAEQEEEGDEEEDEEEQEEEEDARTEGSIPEEEEEEEEEDEGEDEEEEMEEGDDGYEQISSDEDDLDNGSFKLPTFDMDYTPEDLASVPPVQYDPYERELRPLLYFTPPYKTRFDTQFEKASVEEPRDPGGTEEPAGGEEAEAVAQLKELLASIGDDRDARWVTALEEAPALLAKGLAYLVKQGESEIEEPLGVLVQWALQALSMEIALTQPIALNLRQLKAGAKLASQLAECPQGLTVLLRDGALGVLLELIQADHVSSTLKLSILKALGALTSAPAGAEAFLHAGESEKSGYQRLVQLFLREETVRVITAGNAILQKSHMYEVLVDLQRAAAALSEPQQEEMEEAESPMEEEPSINSSPVSEAELDRLAGVLEELHHLLETAPHCMVQPPGKAFPTTARVTGPQERDDPYPTLYRYMHACHFLESTAAVLSAAAAAGHLGVTQAVRELLRFLSLTQSGLLFLLAQPTPANLLLRLLASMAEAESEETAITGGEGGVTGPGFGEEGFGVWLMQALHALQGVSELMSHVAMGGDGGAGLEEGDNPEVLGMLHALYLMTFTQTGRSAVAHVFSLDNNLSCLVTLLQHHSKDGQGEAKARKAVTYNYACMLVLLVVQTSNELRMMEQFAAPLLTIAKADDLNAKLQELSKWLEPLEKVRFEIGSIPTLIDYIKQNVENVLTAEGAGLVTALRVLCHIASAPPAVEGQQRDLKWSLAGVQLFSGEGLDTCVRVLQKLCSVLLQPWRVHGHMGPTPQRCMILSICISTLRLLRTMLMELLRGGAFQFRDTRVASVLVSLHMIVCSIPASGRLDGEETRVQALIVDVLLTFTQGVNEEVTHTEETLASNTWSLMLKEVLSSLLKAPEGLFSGLTLLSELLPLPLPMQSTQVISVQDVAVALNTRKLWSMHIRAQWKVFSEALRCVCATSCPPLLAMLRRMCVQLADLSSPTATLIMKMPLELLLEELQPAEGKGVCWGQVLRLLSLMDALVSQKSCKSAALHLLSGSVSGDEQLADLFPLLLSLLVPPADHSLQQQQCSEIVGTILQSLCDQDISLVVSPPGETCVSEAEQLANALPGREMMTSVCNALLEVLGNSESSVPLLLTCIRTLTFLTEHDYGLFHLKVGLKKHGGGLYTLLKRLVFAFNKDSADLLSALLDFLRQIVNTETMCVDEAQGSGEESAFISPRLLSGCEMKGLLQWEDSDSHPLPTLEKQITKLCKEDDSLETMLETVIVLRQTLETATDAPPAVETEPTLPPPETLAAQFNHRTVFILSETLDEQLKTLWFSPFQTDDIEADLDMVKVDLVGLAQECCPELDLKAELERSFLSEPSSPGHTKAPKGFRLGKHKHETFITSSGKSDYIEPAKRAHIMAAPRGRGGRGGFGQNLNRPHDIFRQRKQNTSRPPSMHVDDFVAAEFKDITTPLGLLPPKRPPKNSPKPPTRGLFTGNRGRGTFHSQTRFFTPPQPKGVLLSGNYTRREGGRGSSWSGQVPAVTHRGTYSEPRGGQSNFTRGPLPSRQPPASAYRLAPRDRAPRGRGGAGYNGHCFQLLRTPQTWSGAQKACRKEEGDLVSIRNVEDQGFVISQLGFASTDELWIGLNDIKIEGLFDWSDHSTVSFTSWEFGKPAVATDSDDCVLIRGENGNWADRSCDEKHGFICMKQSGTEATGEEVDLDHGCKAGWKRHGSYCYFVGTETKTFDEAKEDCKATDSYLADVSNGVDNAFLASLVGLRPEKYFWLGLSNQRDIDQFVWTNTDFVKFTHWNSEMPGFQQGCVAMATGVLAGLWDLLPCTNKEKYICKHLAEGAVVTVPPPTQTPPKCEDGWVRVGTRSVCAKFFTGPRADEKTWFEARDYCRAIGGDLLSIHSTAELLVGRHGRAWIGLRMPDPDTGYTWTDGSPLNFQHWQEGEPNNHNNDESCAEFRMYHWDESGSWNDVNCESFNDWLCQIRAGVTPRPPPNNTAVDFNTTADGWLVWRGNQYYINRQSMPFENAREYCQRRHGDLVSISSRDENTFLWKQISRSYGSYYVGMQVDLDGSFWWLDGSPVGLQKWDEDQPNTNSFHENCVMMTYYMGFWRTCNCGQEHQFICKRSISAPVNTTAAPPPPPKGGCPLKWSKFDSKCYSIVTNRRVTWEDARRQCITMGGNLVSIPSRRVQAFLITVMAEVSTTDLWIGLNGLKQDGFYWTDGKARRYTNWGYSKYRRRPGTFYQRWNEEDCVVMTSNPTLGTGKWIVKSCNDTNGFVCLRDLDPNIQPQPEPAVSTIYVTLANDSIKVVTKNLTWDDAKKQCESEKANLASLRNEWTQAYVELLAMNLKTPLWIGLNKEQTGGYFRYVDGWHLNAAGWGEGEPSRDKPCVYLDVDGKWKTAFCNQTMNSVCMQTTDVPPTESATFPGVCPEETNEEYHQSFTWMPFKGHCYLFATEEIEWADAASSCVRHGGMLASIEDPAEQQFIKNNVEIFQDSHSGFWIGLYKTHKGTWKWLDKTVMDYTNWAEDEPDDDYGEIGASDGAWRTGRRWHDRAYVCETPKVMPGDSGSKTDPQKGQDPRSRVHTSLIVVMIIIITSVLIVVAFYLYKKSPQPLPTFENPLYSERSQPDVVDTNKLIENAEVENPEPIITL